jgi:hypothetical protein
MDYNSPLFVTVLTLGGGAVGALIMNLWNARLKKGELNHELYQQNKIAAIQAFYDAYAKIYFWSAEFLMMHRNGEKPVFSDVYPKTWIMFEDLKACTDKLGMYFDDEERKPFVTVLLGCGKLCGTIQSGLYQHHKGGPYPEYKLTEEDQMIVENGIREIGEFVRSHFKRK